MNSYSKYIFLFTFGLLINLALSTEAVATIEFYVLQSDATHKANCDFLEIKNNQALCTANNLLIAYDLAQVKTIEVVDNGMSSSFLLFTQEARKLINDKNFDKKQRKIEDRLANGKQKKIGDSSFSIDYFTQFIQKLTTYLKHPGSNNTVFSVISISGLIVFFIGSFGFLIATFRAGVLWGLSCMFLPLVSVIFLFVHWKTAAKPFLVTLLGIVILFIGTFFASTSPDVQNTAKFKPATAFDKTGKKSGSFQCRGKIYCSEMSSCAEATFYLRNCPGTKMDGNNDGIPCEKQWCGQ